MASLVNTNFEQRHDELQSPKNTTTKNQTLAAFTTFMKINVLVRIATLLISYRGPFKKKYVIDFIRVNLASTISLISLKHLQNYNRQALWSCLPGCCVV